MNADSRCWLVLGASSSIARGFARAAAESGHDLLLAGRDGTDLDRLAADLNIRYAVAVGTIAFDAADFASHSTFAAHARHLIPGRMDVFLCFAGNFEQERIDSDPRLAQTTISATYAGAVSVLHQLAPMIEAQGAGRIIVIGSVAGDRGRAKNFVYGSAKAGLHAYAQGLRARLWRSGATVTVIKPGFVDTAATWGRPGQFLLAAPSDIGRACLRAAERGRTVVYMPRIWWAIMTIIKALPEFIAKRLRF
jgi:short-subunit dehydrogenase